MYTGVLIARKHPVTYKDWLYAVRYEFPEWEHYCRSDPEVLKTILAKLVNPKVGIAGIINSHQIPVSSLNPLVNYIVEKRFTEASCKRCQQVNTFGNRKCKQGFGAVCVVEAGHEFSQSAAIFQFLPGTAT